MPTSTPALIRAGVSSLPQLGSRHGDRMDITEDEIRAINAASTLLPRLRDLEDLRKALRAGPEQAGDVADMVAVLDLEIANVKTEVRTLLLRRPTGDAPSATE